MTSDDSGQLLMPTDASGQLRATPDDSRQFPTTSDNASRAYLPESVPKLSESHRSRLRNFANFTHYNYKLKIGIFTLFS